MGIWELHHEPVSREYVYMGCAARVKICKLEGVGVQKQEVVSSFIAESFSASWVAELERERALPAVYLCLFLCFLLNWSHHKLSEQQRGEAVSAQISFYLKLSPQLIELKCRADCTNRF